MKYLDIIFVLLGSFLYSFILFSKTCKVYLTNGFDNQAFFIWDYNAFIGSVPYKDIFYPYGMLSFYKDHHILASAVYILIAPLLLTTIYFCFKKIFGSIKLSLLTLLIFSLFINTFTGWEIFNRYGILVAYALFLTQYIVLQKKENKVSFLGFGVTAGFCFSLMTDIGIYCAALYILLIVIKPIFSRSYRIYRSLSFWIRTIKHLILFTVGFIIGSIPFGLYLFYTNTFFDFLSASSQLSNLALYAKTPFFPGLRSLENILIFSLLFFTVFYLGYVLILTKKTFTLIYFFEVTLILIIILFEQKSIIRSIDRTITFVGILLLFFLLFELLVYLKQTFYKRLSISISYSLILVCLVAVSSLLIVMGPLKTQRYNPGVVRSFSPNEKACIQKNIEIFTSDTVHTEVVQYLKNQPSFNKTVFSFPFEPLFYVLLGQKTPYYSNTYDSSSQKAQEKQIAFIESTDISYVVIDMDKKALQDGVPEYMRSNTLLEYLLTKYKPVKVIDNFLILQKTKENHDIFTSTVIPVSYKNDLLRTDLKHIPATEGRYTYEKIKNIPFTMLSNGNSVTSGGTLVLFDVLQIRIRRSDGVVSQITMQECGENPCLVRLARLPIFFSGTDYTYSLFSDTKNAKIHYILSKISDLW